MASNLASGTLLSDPRIRGRYFRIPKAQKELLEDDSAWSENLSREPYGMLHLPDLVLQNVKDFHTRKNAHSLIPTEPSASRPAQTQPPSSPPGQDSGDEEEHDGSWPPSPEEHHHPPPPQSPPQSQPKRKNPQLLLEEEPTSSGAVSEPLDIAPPGFLTQENGSPVNKAAFRPIATELGRPEPTPPSAQLPVGTVDGTRQPPAKRRRVIEEIRAAEGSDSEPKAQGNVRKPVSKPLSGKPDNNQDSLTSNVSTDSLRPQTAQERRTQAGASRARSDPATYQQHSSLTPSWEGRRQETEARKVVHTGTQIPGPSLAPPPAQGNPFDQSILSATQSSQHLTKPGSARTPYEEYKAAYPDYSESIRKFISACLSVNQLQRDRQLPEFIYDDFVRVSSSDYLLYISECSRKKLNNALTGIQWYNHYVQDMQYTKKVIRRDNLAAILQAHAKEAHSVRRTLGDSQSTSSESGVEESDEDMVDALEQEQQGEEPEMIELDDSGAEDEQVSRVSPDLRVEPPELPKIQVPSKQMREDTPSLSNKAAREQAESVVAEEQDDGDMLVDMSTSRDSPELSAQTPQSVFRPIATPKRGSVSKRYRTTTPNLTFASQEISRGPRASEDPHNLEFPKAFRSASRLRSSHGRNDRSVQQTPASCSLQRDTRPRHASVDNGDEEELEFDPLVPRPPPKEAAQSSAAVRSSPVSAAAAPPASTLIGLAADRRSLSLQRNVNEAAPRRNSNASSLAAGQNHSPATPVARYMLQSRRRSGETRQQQRDKLKAFLEKGRSSASTPASTSTSRK